MKEVIMTKKRLVISAVVVLALSSMGLIFMAPILAYKYMKKDKGYEVIGQMQAAPEKIYNAAVSMAEEKAPKIKIVKKEDDKMFLEVTDGIQTASLKVKKVEEEKSEFTILASVPKEEGQEKEVKKDKEKELAYRLVYMMCTKLDAECSLTKE